MAESVMQKVMRFRDSIAAAKIDRAKLEERLEVVNGKLKTKFDSDTPEQARMVLVKEVATEGRLAKEFSTGLGALEEKFEW